MATVAGNQVSMSMEELQAMIAKATQKTAAPQVEAPKTNSKKAAAPKAQVPSAQEFALPDGVTKVPGGYSIFVPENGRFHVSKSGKSEVHRIQYTCGKGTHAASVFGYFNRPL